MSNENRPVLGAIAVVLSPAPPWRAILVQRKKSPDAGLWGFPGGHVERGETALVAAARELREETGVVATPLSYLGNLDMIRHGKDGCVAAHYFLTAVLCQWTGGTPKAADDAQDARWVSLQDIEAGILPMSDHVGDLTKLALEKVQARTSDRASDRPRA